MFFFFLPLLLSCYSALPIGEVVDENWAATASTVTAKLQIECAGAKGSDGAYRVEVDDSSGWVIVSEIDEGRAWLRDPFGVLPDTCWWLPISGTEPEVMSATLSCVQAGLQDGSCGPGIDAPAGLEFRTPGLARLGEGADSVLPVDGTGFAACSEGIERLDLTPSSYRLVNESERSMGDWLSYIPGSPDLPPFSAIDATDDQVVTWDAHSGDLYIFARNEAALSMQNYQTVSAPRGEGLLTANGRFAAIATDGEVDLYTFVDPDHKPRHVSLNHPDNIGQPLGVAVHPFNGLVWVLIKDGVIGFHADGRYTWHPTPGAEGIFVGRPNNTPTPYVWGNLDGDGVVYRLEPNGISRRHSLSQPLRGAGVGQVFQEIVFVSLGTDGPYLHSAIDQSHLDAIPDGTVGIAMAAFIETPRDEEVLNVKDAQRVSDEFGVCEWLNDDDLLCCVHQERAKFARPQLAWLDERLTNERPGGPAAVVLGVNPAVMAPSEHCALTGDDTHYEQGAMLPRLISSTLHDWEGRGVGTGAALLHNQPNHEYSFWVECPEETFVEAPDECWQQNLNEDSQFAFYQRLTDYASVAPWSGSEPHWTLLGGAFEGASIAGLPTWTDFFGDIKLPGANSDPLGLYFGLLAMDPRIGGVASKELAPESVDIRAFPVDISPSADGWASGNNPTGVLYFPGNTIALPWLYESRRTGLMMGDFTAIVYEGEQFNTEQFEGAEHSRLMTEADFKVQLHYLVTRVLAHADTKTRRWWYFHLQNLNRIREYSLHNGWISCSGDCSSETALDNFIEEVAQWSPQIEWRPRP